MAGAAGKQYRERYLEPDLPDAPAGGPHWHNTLVIPAYRESPALLQRLQQLPADCGRTLVILVLNRPDFDPDPQANSALRCKLTTLSGTGNATDDVQILSLNSSTDLLVHDMERNGTTVPATQGVGLARKTGCDIALLWQSQGAISGQWINSSDADATLSPARQHRCKSQRCGLSLSSRAGTGCTVQRGHCPV